jgi:hypothetical protein
VTADALLVALGRAVGVGEAPGRSIRDDLADRLRERQVSSSSDNFEQVTSARLGDDRAARRCPR